ncbi:AAA family ATPase [Kribbella sp. NPDC005582]|uniref:ATP-binding protein n=1 Tax=Kribbella sp. NPDC005582 TaxID=3156893 RepID=UPI0033B48571
MPPAEERKVVSVLFCDLVGFTTASESADPEDVRGWLAPYHAALRDTVERYGGTVEKFAGDAILAVFGAPRSREDDTERAVRAGLAVLDAVAVLPGGPLEVRIGIETGEALVQLSARPELGEPFVTGMVVNVAARLQSSAPIGAVVVGPGAYAATSRVFGYQPLDPIVAKGISRPVERWRAGPPRARLGADVIRDLSTPMIGRDRDLTLIRTTFDKTVAERQPQFVTLLGEPGIGKSRVVVEFAGLVDHQLVTWREGRCLPYGETPFWPVAEIIKAQAGILDTDPLAEATAKLDTILPGDVDRAWLRSRVGPLIGAESNETVSPEESFAAWRQVLESFADHGPAVLVFEDLHWASDALLAFLDHLAEWLSDLPLLIVGTARPELLDRGAGWTRNALTISVSPLSAAETAQVLDCRLAAQSLTPEARELLVRRADGNPLYAEELARMVNDCGPEAACVDSLPIGITAIIAARLDTLEPDRKALLADAAVIGRGFWAEAVAVLSGQPVEQVVRSLQELVRRELVRPVRQSSMSGQREYTFWHALTRDVAYSQLPRAQRSARHLAAADWLEQQHADTSTSVAHHLTTALDLAVARGNQAQIAEITPRARTYQRRAAELAMNFDTGQALALLDRALALTPVNDPERPEVLTRWGWAAFLAGRLDDARAAYDEAVACFEATGDIAGTARALRASTYVMSNMAESMATIDRVVAMLTELGPSEDLVGALAGQASIKMVASRRGESIDTANQALQMAREHGYAVPMRALESRGLARVGEGDTGGLVDMKDALAALLDGGQGRDTAVTWLNYGFVLWQIEGPVVALATLAEAQEFARRRGLAEPEQLMACTVLQLLQETGETADVLRRCRDQLENPGPAFITLRRIEVLAALAQAEFETGIATARSAAEEAYELAVDAGWPDIIAVTAAPAAATRARDGDQAGVLEILTRLVALTELPGSHELPARVPTLVRAALAVDLPNAAAALADILVPLLPLREYAALTAQALLAEYAGDRAAAADGFERAAASWGTFGNRLEQEYALRGLRRVSTPS